MYITRNISLYNIYASIYTGNLLKNLPFSFLRKFSKCDNVKSHKLYYIWNTPHYAYLNGNKKPYLKYIEKTHQVEHSGYIFDTLNNSLVDVFNAIEVIDNDVEFNIIDGVHRLSIYFNKTNNKIIDVNLIKLSSNYTINDNIDISNYAPAILAALDKTKKTYFTSNGWGVDNDFPAGYHSFENFGLNLIGQRLCKNRVESISKSVDLSGKSILDFGCHTGGLIFNIKNPSYALGIDFDQSAINAANVIKNAIFQAGWHEYSNRYNFECHNLDRVSYTKLHNRLIKYKFDICFIASLGSWIKNWKNLYKLAASVSDIIIFEENNASEGADQISYIKSLGLKPELIISGSHDDLSGNNMRNTYVFRRF